MKSMHIITFILVIVGALNWGLIGLLNFNLVTTLFGSFPSFERIVYVAIGLSSVYLIAQHKKDCKTCTVK